jgi:hypothetical protein
LFDELKSKQLRTQGISRQSTFFSLGNIADCKEVQSIRNFGERQYSNATAQIGECRMNNAIYRVLTLQKNARATSFAIPATPIAE